MTGHGKAEGRRGDWEVNGIWEFYIIMHQESIVTKESLNIKEDRPGSRKIPYRLA